jgi:hypothetical protein
MKEPGLPIDRQVRLQSFRAIAMFELYTYESNYQNSYSTRKKAPSNWLNDKHFCIVHM